VNKHCTKVYKEKLSVFQKYQYHSLVQWWRYNSDGSEAYQ
jgi:hypothetical protein